MLTNSLNISSLCHNNESILQLTIALLAKLSHVSFKILTLQRLISVWFTKKKFDTIQTSRIWNIKIDKNNSLRYTFYDLWNVQRRNPKQEFKINYDTTNQTKGISYYISKASKICQEGEVFNEQKCSPFSLVYFLTMRYRLFILIGVNKKCPVIEIFMLNRCYFP